jgi:target of rapamycin complex 2 subunit MAPKAP1
MPEPQISYATPRMGVIKTLRIRHLDLDITNQVTTMDITTDSYIAEILDHVCKLWNLDKAAYTLKVSNTTTVAPPDRTVEALGTRSDLDLVRRRFGAGPLSLTGSPGSASPNAPLLIDIDGPKKGAGAGSSSSSSKLNKGSLGLSLLHPLAQKQDLISSAANFKKYNVTRKHLTAFAQASHKRILALDADYMHIMPLDVTTAADRTIYSSGNKTTSIPFADITSTKVSSRHPKVFRVIIRRAGESKRYDFEAKDAGEAAEIVEEVKKVMVPQ